METGTKNSAFAQGYIASMLASSSVTPENDPSLQNTLLLIFYVCVLVVASLNFFHITNAQYDRNKE